MMIPKVGDRVEVDEGQLYPNCTISPFQGTVLCVHEHAICVRRDDGETGEGCNDSWWVGTAYIKDGRQKVSILNSLTPLTNTYETAAERLYDARQGKIQLTSQELRDLIEEVKRLRSWK